MITCPWVVLDKGQQGQPTYHKPINIMIQIREIIAKIRTCCEQHGCHKSLYNVYKSIK